MAEQLSKLRGPLKWVGKKQSAKLLPKFEGIYDMSDEEAKKTPFFNKHNMMFYLKDMGKKRVSEYLETNKKPVLIMQGDSDFHVSVEEDFNEYKRILQNHADATFKLYPGLNHVFMPMVTGNISKVKKEYSKPQNVAQEVIDDIAQWLHNN